MIGSPLAWAARYNDLSQWMYIDAGAAHEVYGVVTQGRQHTGHHQWVTSYKVEVYLSGGWVPVTNEAGSFTFTGNTGIGDTQVWQRFIF